MGNRSYDCAANATAFSESFTYNAVTSCMDSLTFTYDSYHKHAEIGYEGNGYAYDANSNMTCRIEEEQTYLQTYNAENRLSGIAAVSGDCYDPGSIEKTWLYTYDGDGVKAKQEYSDGSIVQTTYYYAGGAYEVETDGTNESVRQYYTLGGAVIAMRADSTFTYFLTDHLGSVVGVADANGALLSETRYMPFGKCGLTWARSLRPTTASPSREW